MTIKIILVAGTRPELIRLSKVIPKLDEVCDNIFVYTGQSFSDNMSKVFFDELNIREPDYNLGIGGLPVFDQIGQMFIKMSEIIDAVEPDRMLVLGDTNSALSAFVAKRKGTPVYHMEAGNRCYDSRVPEEDNRRVIDHCSDIHMPYTERSRKNLLAENIKPDRVFVTGNPIYEVIKDFHCQSNILETLNLNRMGYFLLTAHRQENIDDRSRLRYIMLSCARIKAEYGLPIIFSCHPKTRANLAKWNIGSESVALRDPFGFNDFYHLERNALCVLSDSGTIQEEAAILRIPCVTLRDVTERPETVECGANILSGVEPDNVLRCVKVALSQSPAWDPPAEYLRGNVSDTVVRIVTGYLPGSPEPPENRIRGLTAMAGSV